MCHQDRHRRRGPGPWAGLPGDVLELILNNLSFIDHARCSAVCKHWNSIASATPHFQSLHLPWLLLSPDRSTTSETCALYSPLERRAHHFNLPSAPRVSRVLGSSRGGWLLTQNDRKNHHHSLHLSNPFTNRTIRLPRLWFKYFKGVSSSAPPNCNLVLYSYRILIFCRPGDEEWSHIEMDHAIRDIAFFKGLLYCATSVDFDPVVIVYEFGPQPVCRNVYTEINRLSIYDACDEHHEESVYLAESAGELLMVIHHWTEVNCTITTVHFGVYRLDLSVPQWVEVRSLGDEALILGADCSSINTETFSEFGFKRNHIYFKDGAIAAGCNYVWRGFCLENQTIQPFSPRDSSPPLKSRYLFLMLDA